MAPIKRGADSDHAGPKKSKHTADERAAKRQRKSDVPPNDSKPKPAEKALPVASVLKQEEQSFPRGGASVLTPLEHKQIHNEAARDVLFEQSTNKKAGKAADSDNDVDMEDAEGKKATKKKKKSKARKGDAAEQEEAGIKIEGLSYKRVAPGSVILGQVTQITSRDIALALPNNLIGFVPITAVSDQFTERIEALLDQDEKEDANESSDDDDADLKNIFRLGQYLRTVVTTTGEDSTKPSQKNKKRIELSVKPQDANNRISKSDLVPHAMVQASVISVEDHGLVMDLGLADGSIKGFMSTKEVGHGLDHSKIEKGSVFLCMVTGVSSNGKIVKLSADYQKIGNVKKTNFLTEAPTVDVFAPGTAVEVLINEVTATGLAGTIMGLIDATADIVHAGAGSTQQDLTSRYKIGEKVKARIICTFPDEERRKLGVSVLDHVLSLSERQSADSKAPLNVLPVSSIVEEAKVTKVQPISGLFLDVGVKRVPGFAHISRLSDDKVDSLSETTGAYKLNSTHRARVVGYNPIDGVYVISLEKKILDQPFLRVEDIKVGAVVKGKVEKVMITASGSGAIIVNLADGINGLVRETHIADVHLQHPEKKFREGAAVTVRVLSTEPERRQVRLTLKKTLVNSEAPVWADYSDVQIGEQAPGTIIKILPTGAIVQFYGDLTGFLPISEMSEAYIKDPTEHFRIGQTVTVNALSINAEAGKMTLSCRDPASRTAAEHEGFDSLSPGSIVKGVVSEKSEKNVTVELEGTTIKGTLKFGHLTNGPEKKEESRMKRIKVGQTLEDLVILTKSDKRPVVALTNKPSLVTAAKSGALPARFEDIKEGLTVSGFVRNIDDQRVFVEYAGGLVGLLLKSQMTEDMQKTVGYGLENDSLITARVLNVDQRQRRFLITMRDEQASERKSSVTSKGPATDNALINPIDENCKSMSDFSFGKLTTARITSVKETQLNVQLADGLFGRVDASEAFDDWEHIKDSKHPLRQFSTKQNIPVRVIGIHDARNHRFLPISHRTSKVPVFELTAKAVKLSKESDLLTLDKLAVASSHIAFVNNIAQNCVWVNITPNIRGRIDFMDLADDVSLLNDVAANFPVGSAIKVRVKSVDAAANRLDLTATSDTTVKPTSLKDLTPGMILPGRVTKVTERNIMVQLSESVSAPVTLTEFTDDYAQANPTLYSKNDIVRVCVLEVDAPNKRVHVTMRPSKVLSSSLQVKDPQIANIRQLKVNDVVRGFVKNVADKGVFVALGPSVTAFVRISDLSDSYIKDWKSVFEVDQLVKGKVLQVDPQLNHVQISLKASMLDKDYVPPLTFDDVKASMVVTGKVRKVEDFGVFIVIDNSKNVSGLCHRSEIADQTVEDVRKLYTEGDAVKAVILKVDREKRKVNFGLKASYLKNRSSDDEDSDEDGGVEIDMDSDEDEEMDDDDEEEIDLSNVKDMESDSDEDDESADEMEVDSAPSRSAGGLSTSGFDWTGNSLEQEQKDQADDSDDDATSKKKKKSKKPTIKEDRTGDLDVHGPQSVADFERLLMGDPNNSTLWMQYMAFQIGLNEVQKAREIGERALKTINIREQDEKANIWTALLNLEIEQGNDDAVDETFKRACEYCDPEDMHNKLITIYTSTGRHSKADDLFQRMTKNKSITPNPSFWLNYATFLMTTQAQPDRARALLARATQSVPAHQHRYLTAKFGALEFMSPHGDAERGRTVFEGLLATFPKRWDLWDQFVDLERSKGEKDNVRGLYERMAQAKMKARRARFVFRRWAEWEEKNGSKKTKERVEALAKEYAEKLRKGGEVEASDDEE